MIFDVTSRLFLCLSLTPTKYRPQLFDRLIEKPRSLVLMGCCMLGILVRSTEEELRELALPVDADRSRVSARMSSSLTPSVGDATFGSKSSTNLDEVMLMWTGCVNLSPTRAVTVPPTLIV